MKLIIEDFDIHYENISFAKIKKNVIMEGTFTKIVYSDAFITINGLYLTVPLILSSLYSDEKINYIETESKSNYLYFYSYTPHNLLIIKKIANIEYEILSYYKKFYKIKKKIVFNLFNLLNSGRIKIYKENHYAEEFTDFMESKMNFSNLPSRATANLSSPSQATEKPYKQSVEKLYGFSVAREGEDKFTVAREGKLTFLAEASLKPNCFFPEQSVNDFSIAREGEFFNIFGGGIAEAKNEFFETKCRKTALCPEKMAKIVLKISGIWETSENIGITYKFTEMFQKNSFIV